MRRIMETGLVLVAVAMTVIVGVFVTVPVGMIMVVIVRLAVLMIVSVFVLVVMSAFVFVRHFLILTSYWTGLGRVDPREKKQILH